MPIHELIPMFLRKRLPTRCLYLGFLLWVSCYEVDERSPSKEVDTSPQLALKNWETVVYKSGQTRVHLQADSLGQTNKQGLAHFQGHIQVVFFKSNGDTASVLNAHRGYVGADGHDLSIAGHVRVFASDSTRLETDSLRWDREKERIYGDGLVSIFRPEGREEGIGFDASEDLKQWTLREVKTHVTGRDK